MVVRKRFLVTMLLAFAAWYSLNWIEANVELATVHTHSGAQDYYARVFIVDDAALPGVWIRAERPDRLWLKALRNNPEVVVHRGGQDFLYTAEPWEGSGGHQRIDGLFREKYGPFDALSGIFWRRDAVPIRLVRRYPEEPF